ncbi:MAG: energy-coupling factor ABC transporter permease [Endomicrobium sp.]|jgi:cobalt/nickel transport system permease protein|nr:energy-coupling factor ABC transporter permease [Endomicrobium sp.]
MHIPDGFLNNNLAGGLLAGALGMIGYCLNKILKSITVSVGIIADNVSEVNLCSQSFGFSENTSKYFQRLTLVALWVFAFQMFNIPVKSATSAHLIGGAFAAILAGPFSGFIIMSFILIIQSLFFSDGGVLALGANILNMAFIGSFLSYYVYKAFSNKSRHFGVFATCFFSVMTASLACLTELGLSRSIVFSIAFKNMMSLHFGVSCIETLITLALLKLFRSVNGESNE